MRCSQVARGFGPSKAARAVASARSGHTEALKRAVLMLQPALLLLLLLLPRAALP
eukprot:COSAG06_NODE_52677_length_304_cov_0.917073_1_plen_54_part_10